MIFRPDTTAASGLSTDWSTAAPDSTASVIKGSQVALPFLAVGELFVVEAHSIERHVLHDEAASEELREHVPGRDSDHAG